MSRLIDSYICCPRCGAKDYLLEASQRRCAACGHRDFNNPVVAVAALILDAEERLLLIRRAREPALGKLAMPGGFVDAGESLEEAMRREVTEEIGLELRETRYLCSHPNDYVYAGLARPVCDAFFTARATSFDVVMQHGEVSEWVLRPLMEIDPAELAFDSMRHALAVLRTTGTP